LSNDAVSNGIASTLPKRKSARGTSYGCGESRLGPFNRILRPVETGHECASADQGGKNDAAAETDLEDTVRRLGSEQLNRKCVHPGVVPVHQVPHQATQEAAWMGKLFSNESRRHL
jgi:hypothetical protein